MSTTKEKITDAEVAVNAEALKVEKPKKEKKSFFKKVGNFFSKAAKVVKSAASVAGDVFSFSNSAYFMATGGRKSLTGLITQRLWSKNSTSLGLGTSLDSFIAPEMQSLSTRSSLSTLLKGMATTRSSFVAGSEVDELEARLRQRLSLSSTTRSSSVLGAHDFWGLLSSAFGKDTKDTMSKQGSMLFDLLLSPERLVDEFIGKGDVSSVMKSDRYKSELLYEGLMMMFLNHKTKSNGGLSGLASVAQTVLNDKNDMSSVLMKQLIGRGGNSWF